MKEFVMQALVLGVRFRGSDRVADLLTPSLGRFEARMVNGRAVVSKFAPHADPLNLLTVRVVKKNRYTLADAVGLDRFPSLRRSPRALAEALAALAALRELVPKEEPDPRLFHEMKRALGAGCLTINQTLKILGYDPRRARCARCEKSGVRYFFPRDGIFLCRSCFTSAHDEVVLQVTP